MLIVMQRTARGSENGITSKTYEAGKQYDVDESLGSAFVRGGEAKAVQAAPQNRAVEQAPVNRRKR